MSNRRTEKLLDAIEEHISSLQQKVDVMLLARGIDPDRWRSEPTLKPTLTVREMREWLDKHERSPPVPCLLCNEPVDKDTVVDHLVQNHPPGAVAVLVALWWFMEEERSDS